MAQQQQREEGGLSVVLNTLRADEMQKYLKASLSNPSKLEAFTEATAAALRTNPGVFLDCDKASLYNAILEAARKGIVPDGKQGALAPFNTNVAPPGQPKKWVKKVQFMIMPQGIIDAFAKVGITAYAQSVYENDTFRFWSDDTGQHVLHEYDAFRDRGQRIGSYAAGITKGGRPYVEAMSNDELSRARAKSRSPDSGPWKEWPERMEQKSALHRLDKRMPGAGVLGDDDNAPETIVAVQTPTQDQTAAQPNVQEASGGDDQQRGDENATVGQAARSLTDESKRPRGLQSIIDSEVVREPEKVPVGMTENERHAEYVESQRDVVEPTKGGSPF